MSRLLSESARKPRTASAIAETTSAAARQGPLPMRRRMFFWSVRHVGEIAVLTHNCPITVVSKSPDFIEYCR